jgi:hypothetical protein
MPVESVWLLNGRASHGLATDGTAGDFAVAPGHRSTRSRIENGAGFLSEGHPGEPARAWSLASNHALRRQLDLFPEVARWRDRLKSL